MAGHSDDKGGHGKPQGAEGTAEATADARHARLAQELRANLLKRKAQNRARKSPQAPPKEGGQTKG